MLKRFLKFCVLGWAMTSYTFADTVLEVTVSHVKNNDGVVVVAVYPETSADTFPYRGSVTFDTPKPNRQSAQKGDMVFRIPLPSAGTYAVSVFHDENNNGRFDMFLGLPREDFAFGNNAKGILLPPDFDKASFVVEKNTIHTHKIRLGN